MITAIKKSVWFVLIGLIFFVPEYVLAQSPEIISTVSDWVILMESPSAWDANYILSSDLDLSDVEMSPVGTYDVPFTGSIDGNGFMISNAVLNLPDTNYVGLFGYAGDGGTISNLGVESITVAGTKYVGGLVGYIYHGKIDGCYTSGTVSGESDVGGLVGRNIGNINSCYSSCSISGNRDTGGLVGNNYGSSAVLRACYSCGSVADANSGGLVGTSDGFVYSCFWDVQTSGRLSGTSGKGLTTAQMKSALVYQNAGWADKGWTINNDCDYPRLSWQDIIGEQILPAQSVPLPGSGTSNDPYQIGSPNDLALLSWYNSVLDKHIILIADIDARGIELSPIGDLGCFTGVFDGNGLIIKNISIAESGSDYVGLFSIIYAGQVSRLGLPSIDVSGNKYVGGLVGYNIGGQINSCYVTGSVSGQSFVGGLAGCSIIAAE